MTYGPGIPARPELPVWCFGCQVWQWNGDSHVCAVYDGPECKTPGCTARTLVAQVAAPGYGTVRVCKAGHREELTPCGELTLADVM